MDGYNAERKFIEGAIIVFSDGKRGAVGGIEKVVFRDVPGFDINLELDRTMRRKKVDFYCVIDRIKNGSSSGYEVGGEKVTLSVIYGEYVD